VVLAGVDEGERVVVNGSFKVDSAVQILAKSSMMSLPGGHSATEHQHHGGSDVMYEDYQSERMDSRMGRDETPETSPGHRMSPGMQRPSGSTKGYDGEESSFHHQPQKARRIRRHDATERREVVASAVNRTWSQRKDEP
jgi:hypothetical protein